tara:strand:+ start:76 stop:594 length:519 start_codon:yes stop_codon:yes gene_type:complete
MSSELRVDKIIPTSGVPTGGGGGIIQIVQNVKQNVFTSSANSTWTDITNMAISITPKFNTSKILISVVTGISNGSSELHILRLLRDSTVIGASNYATENGFALVDTEAIGGVRSRYIGHVKAEILDSPATTSSVAYKVQFWKNGGNNMHINRRALNTGAGFSSMITAYEVSA